MKYSIFALLSLNFLYSNSITIYNNNLALVEQNIDTNLTKASNKITINNLPKTIISDSIFADNLNISLKEYLPKEYNYLKNLIELNLNSKVDFLFNKKLLSGIVVNKQPFVIKSNGKLYLINDIKNVTFYKEPKSRSSSKLILRLANEELVKEIKLNYLITSIGWRANYIINLDKNSLSLNSWATITNSSGIDFKNYNLKLFSGEVNRVRVYNRNNEDKNIAESVYPAVAEIPAESIAGYYSFVVPGKHDIKNNIQLKLFERKKIEYKKYGVVLNNRFRRHNESNLVFKSIIEFKNGKKSILPFGLARVFKKGYYIGEAQIKNTPKGEKVKLAIGTLFDAVGSSKVVEYIDRNKYKKVTTKYSVKNRGNKKITLKIYENIPVYGNSIKLNNECNGVCTYKKIDAFRNRFTLELKPGAKYDFNSTFEVIK